MENEEELSENSIPFIDAQDIFIEEFRGKALNYDMQAKSLRLYKNKTEAEVLYVNRFSENEKPDRYEITTVSYDKSSDKAELAEVLLSMGDQLLQADTLFYTGEDGKLSGPAAVIKNKDFLLTGFNFIYDVVNNEFTFNKEPTGYFEVHEEEGDSVDEN